MNNYKTMLIHGAVLFLCFSCDNTQVATEPEFRIGKSEIWNIEGVNFKTEGTFIFLFDESYGLFVVKVRINTRPDESMRELAKIFAQYAIDNNQMIKVEKRKIKGKNIEIAPMIGVALIKKEYTLYPFIYHAYGYKYVFDLDELNSDLNKSSKDVNEI